MKIVTDIAEMQSLSAAARRSGQRIVVVPTMGFLHEGHASLLREGRRRGELLVLTIFVNPTQFGVGEDFERYPRNLEKDRAIAEAAGVDVIFAPHSGDMYPAGYQSWVDVERLTLPLCGASRPGHFRGVTTVVTKLFNIVQPHVALFGKKDYQQLAVIRQMVADLNMPIEVIGMPIVREEDGLAMSSRNAYLTPEERRAALSLSRALKAARVEYERGERSATALSRLVRDIIEAEPLASVDYIEARNGKTLEDEVAVNDATLVAVAVKIGTTRLIDNCVMGEE